MVEKMKPLLDLDVRIIAAAAAQTLNFCNRLQLW